MFAAQYPNTAQEYDHKVEPQNFQNYNNNQPSSWYEGGGDSTVINSLPNHVNMCSLNYPPVNWASGTNEQNACNQISNRSLQGENFWSFQCDKNTVGTNFECILQKHRRQQEDCYPFICACCALRSQQMSNLEDHGFQEKDFYGRFRCIWCNYKTSSKYKLFSHHSSQWGINVFKCNYCSYSSNKKYNLKRHKRSRHNLSEDEWFNRCILWTYTHWRVTNTDRVHMSRGFIV